jgi:hypothetical protein
VSTKLQEIEDEIAGVPPAGFRTRERLLTPLTDRYGDQTVGPALEAADHAREEVLVGYEPLPIAEVNVDDLRLDLDNYRIPTHRDDETSALKYLFLSEDVLGAARAIIRDGYFDNEVPLVVADDDGGYVVLEGNRRVSALKALLNPAVIPGHEGEVQGLLKRFAVEADQLPTRIRVMVAESRGQVAPRIARLHSGRSKRAWSLDQQATYYYSLLDKSATPEDVRAHYPDVNVTRFLKMAAVRRFLANARFTDRSLRSWVSGKSGADDGELKMSAFEYAYKVREIAAAIGLSFDRDGLLEPRAQTPERIGKALGGAQLVALEYLVSEFRAERLNTRSLEFKRGTPAQSALVARLEGRIPSSDPSGGADDHADSVPEDGAGASEPTDPHGGSGIGDEAGNSDASTSGSGEGESSSDAGRGRGPNHPDTRLTLDLTGLTYGDTHVNLNRRYQELRKLEVRSVPIATAMVMRSVLESTIKWHYEASGVRAHGELKDVFARVKGDYGRDRALRAAIGRVHSGGSSEPGSITWFNGIVHDGDAAPSEAAVRAAWDLINPLLRHLLRQAATAGPPSAS